MCDNTTPCHSSCALQYMKWKKLSVTTAWYRCWQPPLVVIPSDALGVSIKPVVWMCLRLEGWSHRDSPTEATSTHTDEGSSQCDISFSHAISISCKKADTVANVHFLHIAFLSHIQAHTHTSAHIPIYLLIYHLHVHVHVLRRLPTGLVIAARLFCIHMRKSLLSLFPSYEYKIIKAEKRRPEKSFPSLSSPILSPRGASSDSTLSYFISLRREKCKGEPSAVNFNTRLLIIQQNGNSTRRPKFPFLSQTYIHSTSSGLSLYSFLMLQETVFKWTLTNW